MLLKILRHLFALAAIPGIWLGILFYPKDLKEAPEALKEWGPYLPDKITALLWFSGLLVLWIIWRDLRPYALPHIKVWFGWRPRAEIIMAIDNKLSEGVRLRNRIRSDEPIEIIGERANFKTWNDEVLAELAALSLKERSYFRTLDTFQPTGVVRISEPERSHLEFVWNEKLKRLREIISRIEE